MGDGQDQLKQRYDVVVLGAGPAGQKAALQAVGGGRTVLLVEQELELGGECVRRGTIPSKTLRETALSLSGIKRRSGGVINVSLGAELQLASLMARKEEVISAHEAFITREVLGSGIDVFRGRASFVSSHRLELLTVARERRQVDAQFVFIATGSRPRTPAEVPVDHEVLFDSDSILSMTWLPKSLTVLGAGVIACEYASIFAALGVRVTIVDRGQRPVAFLDDELTRQFVADFEHAGGTFLGGRSLVKVTNTGLSSVVTELTSGERIETEKLLCCLGRTANVDSLNLAAAGLGVNERGLVAVDANCRTAVSHVYAIGDVIGPPSLASSSMEQGRRAVRHALGMPVGQKPDLIPSGVYTIPEMSAVGLTEAQARANGAGVIIGRAPFHFLARAHIAGSANGLLKLVTDAAGKKVLGVHVVGEGAAELVHLGQLAMVGNLEVDTFVDGIFNFPTLAEAYRVAALDVVRQRPSSGST